MKMSLNNITDVGVTEADIKEVVSQVLNETWENLPVTLSSWQIAQLKKQSVETGISCLLRMWLLVQSKLEPGSYCNSTWDGHYCWPPTAAGANISRQCSDAFQESQPKYAAHLQGNAYRSCQADGSWLKGNWTDYTECADSYEEWVARNEEEKELVTNVQYILFIGSIFSLVFLLTAISIFCWFRSIWCDRVTIHLHLMAALTLRYVLLYIITEAYIFQRKTNYRDVDWVCKAVLIIYLYATLTSVNWMFIQGVYLNGKLTTNVFDRAAPFGVYYTVGWLIPVPLLAVYAFLMERNHPLKCWKGYSEMDEIWIILGPIVVALLVNLMLLINILRILLTKVRRNESSSDSIQFQRAAKATLILSPILGINNLLFVYNPGGAYHKFYVILNSLFGSTQGVFVALVYCYLSSDVCSAIRRGYRRFLARRNANRTMQQRRANSCSTSSGGLIVEQPVHFYNRGGGRRSNPRSLSRSSPNITTNTQLSPVSSSPSTYASNIQVFRATRKVSGQRFCPISSCSYNNLRNGNCSGGGSTSSSSSLIRYHSHHQQQQHTNPFLPVSQNNNNGDNHVSCGRETRSTAAAVAMAQNDVIIPLSELV